MSQLEVDKVIPQSGTTLTIGDSGDTITIASGATLSGDLNASNLTSGTVPDARITGTYTGITGLDLTDNSKIRLGTGNDLEIFHDGSNSNISDVGTGGLILRTDGTQIAINKGSSENMAKFITDGAVELYHDNSKKFETTSAGATITGTATVTGGLTVDTDTLFVDSSNNRVGIGTNSPGFDLVVKDASGACTIRAENGADNKIVDLIADSTGGLIRTIGSYPLVFNTNQTERVRIDASGNLLISKTALEYDSTAGIILRNDGLISCIRSGGNVTDFNRLSSDGEIARFSKDGTTVGSIGAFSGKMHLGTGNANFRFRDDLTAIIPANSDGSNSDNDLDLGYSTVRWRRLYLSDGVFLGGTSTANKLDDYETGTWTPSFVGGTSGSGYARQSGRYTKVGNKVFFELDIEGNGGLNSTTGQLTIGGLPFTSNSSAPYGGGVMNYTNGIYTSEQLLFHIGGNNTEMYIYQLTGSNFLGSEAVNVNKRMLIHGQYTTA